MRAGDGGATAAAGLRRDLPPGARGLHDPHLAAALREATEESGITGLTIDELPTAIHVHPVTCSLGVPTRHLDVQFVARAPQGAQAEISEESVDLRWWPLDELPGGSDFGLRHLAALAKVHLSSPAE